MTTLDVRPSAMTAPADRLPRRAMLVAAGIAAALLPWCVVLAHVLPATATVQHWSIAWVGLDSGEAAAAALTAWLILRRDPRAALTAAVGGALLLADAWFDVTTAAAGAYLTQAVLMAALLEIPLAVTAFWYASTVIGRLRP
jgi:hypothetical protein